MDEIEKIQQNIDNQNALIAKVEQSMGTVPEQQKSTQTFSLNLLKDEVAMLTANKLSMAAASQPTVVAASQPTVPAANQPAITPYIRP